MESTVRILHVLGNTNLGGAESRIMDLYRHIDRGRVQFDFLVHTAGEGYYDKEITALGGRVYRVPRFRIYNYFSYVHELKRFFGQHHEYHMIQGHMTSTAAIYLPLAKSAGIPITIAHARSAGVDQGIKGILTRYLRRNLSEKTDYMFTCSELAGISVFGGKAVKEGKTTFVPNAIESGKFEYDPGIREKIRRELGVEGSYMIGHVGRFHYAKNHEYLLQVFASLCMQETEKKGEEEHSDQKDYVLLLLGDGAGMEEIRKLAGELGIGEKVFFAGRKGNVWEYYQAMDYFIYPSRYEGLPGTVLEAQAAGLRCLISDSICKEVLVTDLVKSMDIKEDVGKWASYVMQTKEYVRRGHGKEIAQAGFDVERQAEKMMKFYETGSFE